MNRKFNDNLNTAVITSIYVVSKNSEIVRITHHGDGLWEFMGNERIGNAAIRVISLAQIIEIDDSILDVSDMPGNFYAVRKSNGYNWIINSKT